ncbi:SirB2 family protein [Roseateles koreensis]|uniref:SirB2 family protein n=1 Tax=Roseateles koreensis TaxID=2987526 RepID=A0ABT5KQB1_9BURK|nr:SirB2 family protein [Roseateles koreensis]MDC8785041.1 SirB2 family protein [Roseateles koreensis]
MSCHAARLKPMDYLILKTIHQSAAALSITGFFARGLGHFTGAAWVHGRPAKNLPHLLDTALLLSALALAWTLRLHPGNAPWLTAKLCGLLIYIGLGTVALKPGRPLPLRWLAWVAALATVGWMVSVAIRKSPWGFWA